MKKIVGAAVAAALVAGVASAEVSVGLNVRVRPSLYEVESYTKTEKTDAYSKTTYADLDGFSDAKDTLSVKGSNDYAGVSADITLVNPDAASTKGSLEIDNYSGWLKFGGLKFTAGTYDSRYTNRGNYTSTEQGILDEEFSKTHGLSTKNGVTALIKPDDKTTMTKLAAYNWLGDFDNASQVAAGNALSFIGEYTFADLGGGDLLLKAGLLDNYSDTVYDSYTNDDGDSFTQAAGYVVEAAWKKKDVVAVDVIFKNPYNKAYGFGLYVTPLMIPNTKNVSIGFTYGTMEDYISAYAIDLRGTYNITDKATIAIGAKYESVEIEDGAGDKVSDNKETKGELGAVSGFQIATEVSYQINDLATVALNLGYFNQDLTDEWSDVDDGSQKFVVSGRAKFTAGKNAAITTAARYTRVLDAAEGKVEGTFDIPVVLRVKL